MFSLYSSGVVAPIHNSLPLASKGFNKFAISIFELPAVPAPVIICISSINKTISFLSDKWSNTILARSSKSPLNLVPATIAPRSKLKTVFSSKGLGTSPFIIFFASPSAIAVLPTPGSPNIITLFFLRLANTCAISSISTSLPIISSMFPCLA